MTAGRTDRTNTIEIVRTPTGLIAVPAGRGVWVGQRIIDPPSTPVSGNVVARLHRGDVVSDNVIIPVEQSDVSPALAETTVTIDPASVTFTFPAGATFTRQAIATLTATVQDDGSTTTGTWTLLAAPAGYTIAGAGHAATVTYTGARPTVTRSFVAQYNVAGTPTATGGGASAVITTGIVAPPERTDATIADITRTNLDDFTQAITQLFSGTDLTYQIVSSNTRITLATLTAANVASFDPQADGTATITVIAFNDGGSAQYEFDITFNILQQPTISWPSENYNANNQRYEFTSPTSAVAVPLGSLLPTVSAPSGTVGAATLSVSDGLVGSVDWLQTGALRMAAGAATSDRQYLGELVVTVAATATVRAATFRRDIFIEVSSEAVPITPPARNPAFAPAGGLVRTVRVGEFFDIDFTGAFTTANVPLVPVVQNSELISAVLRTGTNIVRCTGLAEGSTSYVVSGVWVVRVVVIAAAETPTATVAAWYQRTATNTYTAISSLSLSLEENSARANLLADAPLFLTLTQIQNRSVTYQERPPLAGLEVSQGALQSITLPGGATAQARQVQIFGDGTDFDFEQQSAYAVNLLAEAETDVIAGTTYAAHTAQLPIALAITDVFEPTAAPDFGEVDAAVNLPAGTDGTTTPFSLGTFDAGQGATYSIPDSVKAVFAIDAAAELTFIGGAAAAVVGNSWTVPITATNSLGSVTVDVLVTVKAVVVMTFDPATIDWKLPVGTTGEFVLGSITVNSTSNDRAGLPPVPTLTPTGDDSEFIKILPTAHNVFQVSYTGLAATLSTSDLEFGLQANSPETGLCLAATAAISARVPAVPATPIFDDDSYTYELTDGADPPPAVVVGLPTATHEPGETQRWRIITAQTGRRLFSINASNGTIAYDGPDAASRATVPSYTLRLGVVNIDGDKESIEAIQDATINVVPDYSPPTANGNWNPGSTWTKAADGSWHGTIQTGAANSVSIDISVGLNGPWAIMSGLTATYRNQTIPSPPTHYAVTRSDGIFNIRGTSVGSETLYLFMSDGTTEEQLVFHVQIVAATTTAASEAVWYTDGAGLSYDVVDSKGITISFPEGQSSPVSRNIYVTYTEIDNRTNGSLAEPTQAGFDIVVGGILRRQITVGNQQIWIDAYQIDIDPTQFDFETQSRYDLTATMNVPQATVGSTTYAAVHKPIEIHLDVTNVNEPPNRTAQAAPSNFELRRRANIIDYSLAGYWISEDNPDRNNLAYRLVQTVVGATSGQSTNAGDYLSASLIGDTFQANAGAGATLTATGVSIRFDIYCREASTGIENPTPLSFTCTAVHERALEDSPLTWASTVPARLEFSVPENVTLPHLLRNNIAAMSTVTDLSAVAGAISYSLREPTYWIERNTDFQWDGTLSLASGGTHDFDMTNAFVIMGEDAAGKTWTLSQSSDDTSVLTVAISGKTATVTASDSLTAAGSTNFYLLGSDGNFVEVYTGYADVAAAVAGTIAAKTSGSDITGILYDGVQTVQSDTISFSITSGTGAYIELWSGGTYTFPASSMFEASAAAEFYQIGSSGTTANLGLMTFSIVNGNLQVDNSAADYSEGTLTLHARLTGSPSTTASISAYFIDDQ